MSDHKPGPMSDELSKPTSVFGLRLCVVLGVCAGTGFVLVLFLITLWIASKRHKNSGKTRTHIRIVSKEVQEIKTDNPMKPQNRIQVTHPFPNQEMGSNAGKVEGEAVLLVVPEGESGKGCILSNSGEMPRGGDQGSVGVVAPDVSHLGWGHWYTLRELEVATHEFAAEKVVGEGGYGIVYHGVLADNTHVAVKNLLNNRGQADREFKVEVEAIGRVRHKNLVRLLGYCAEGAQRLLVYEFVNNGNLEQWLHGDVGPCSPLTWDIRMNIILGTAKGLTYLHEGLEPKVVHRDVKSSNILLDKQWNSKVSDFGLAKLLCSERSFVTTRVMGTFGYVAPEYASTGMLNERSDVYSFGILIMEIISGRNPVDYSRPPDEVNLIDWIKKMVTERNPEGVLDPKLPEKPTSRALKRALLVALRCVDPNAQKRPKMGHIVHMLEAEESLFKQCQDRRGGRELLRHSQLDSLMEGSTEKRMSESDDRSGHENDLQQHDKERG